MQSLDFSNESLVEELFFFKCNVHSQDFLFFLCEFQSKGKLIPLQSFTFHILLPVTVSVIERISEGLHGWKLCCRSFVFTHFRGICSTFSFFSSLCWLSSILNHFFQVFIEKLLFMAIQQLCYNFGSNLIQFGHMCQTADVVNTVLGWSKSCEFMHKWWKIFAPISIQTLHWYFLPSYVDVVNALQNVGWAPVILDSVLWPVQNSHHSREI